MLRKIIMIFTIIICVFVLSLAIIYFFILDRVEPIERPSNVPQDAIYEGGADGGNWIRYIPYKDSVNVFYCEVYNHSSGNILYKGLFKLEDEKITLPEIKELSGVYSGNFIYLKDGRKLTTVVPLDSSTYESMMERTLENPF